MSKYRFPLIFDPTKGSTYQQYVNLIKWLEDKGVKYEFERESSGQFYPKALIVFNDLDATMIGLFFNKAETG